MDNYRVPVADMSFVLNELVELENLTRLPGFEEATDEMAGTILDEASKLAQDVIAPLNWAGDQSGISIENDDEVRTPEGFKDAYQQFIESGWGTLAAGLDYGGQGLPYVLSIPVQEMWQAANLSWGLCPLLTQGAIEAVSHNASDELRAKYLPKMVTGEWTGTMNLTEPQAGSDMAILRSSAERQGDHYLIRGQKIFITWGEHDMAENIIHLVLARLPDAPPGVKGISLFLVPKFLVNEDGSLGERNDCRVVSVEEKIGIHASPTCVMSYGDNEGAIGYLVGEENRGLACMFSMMNNARLGVGLQGIAMADRAYQLARDYANDRPQGIAPGEKELSPIIKHPDVRRMLLTMRALAEAGRALCYVACSSIDYRDNGQDAEARKIGAARAALLTPIVKGWGTEVGLEATSIGVQVHGGMGFVEETGAAQYYRDARILPIYEGTNGIQAADLVGRKTLADGGLETDRLFGEIQAVIDQARANSSFKSQADALEEALKTADQAKQTLLQKAPEDPTYAGSIAFNYMMMMGAICGGWQMLKAAIIAEAKLAQQSGDPEFYKAKIATAGFYLDQILPRYKSHAMMVSAGSDSVMAMDEALF